jgi:hypothetical protein
MTDREIIHDVLGRMANQAPPALGFEELTQPTVTSERSAPRSPFSRRWAIAASAVAASILVVVAILVVRPGGDGATPVGAPVDATVEELRAALASGFESLEAAKGIEGLHEAYIQGHLSAKVWFTARSDGDTAVVQQADIDVQDTAWWLTSATPPAEGERIATQAWVLVDGVAYEAGPLEGGDRSWRRSDPTPSGPLAFGLLFLDPIRGEQFREMLAPSDADAKVTRQRTVNGGAIWVAIYEDRGQSRFYLHPDGHLASWSWLDQGVIEVDDSPVDSGSVSYTPLGDPPPIPVPAAGTPFDPAEFDTPEDFSIGG